MKGQQPQSNTAAYVSAYITELKRCLDLLDKQAIGRAIAIIMRAYQDGRTVFIMGNGGSAATASHMACDLGKGTLSRVYDSSEPRLRVVSLTDNMATITAYANDVSYEDIFVQQLRNLIGHGDVVIALSGSGNSRNVVKAVRFAKRRKAKTIGFLGFKTGGILGKLVDCAIIVDSVHYGPCEDIQLVLDHIVTSCLARMKGSKNAAVPFRLQPT